MKNEINNRYGKLLVIARAKKPEGRPAGAYWLCQCDCGGQKIVRGADLRAGGVNSCGCLYGKHSIKNEVGNRYGKLTVLQQSEKREFGSVCWLCKCDCGKTVTVAGDALRNGTTKSCGCLVVEKSREANYINHTNKIYGKLLALEIDKEKSSLKRHGTYWKCLCECGNYTSVLSSNLMNGSVKSCGCIKTSYGEEVIQSILEENKIKYKKEFTFPDLLSKKHGNLRFDFAIFDNNDNLSHLIEYDGEQHYFSIPQWGGETGLKYRKENDDLKNEYCKKHNIKLIRIPYYELKNINLKLLGVDKNEL